MAGKKREEERLVVKKNLSLPSSFHVLPLLTPPFFYTFYRGPLQYRIPLSNPICSLSLLDPSIFHPPKQRYLRLILKSRAAKLEQCRKFTSGWKWTGWQSYYLSIISPIYILKESFMACDRSLASGQTKSSMEIVAGIIFFVCQYCTRGKYYSEAFIWQSFTDLTSPNSNKWIELGKLCQYAGGF